METGTFGERSAFSVSTPQPMRTNTTTLLRFYCLMFSYGIDRNDNINSGLPSLSYCLLPSPPPFLPPSLPPILVGGGGSGFQPSMDQQRPGGARSAVDQWPDYAHQQRYHPSFKSTSTASLPLLTDQRTDSEAGSMYSPSPWSEIDEEYDPKLNEPDFQGSDTSISAHKFREKQASLPHQAGPPGMMRSRSLEDMRKVVSPAARHCCLQPHQKTIMCCKCLGSLTCWCLETHCYI